MQIPFLASLLSQHSGKATHSPLQTTPKAAANAAPTSGTTASTTKPTVSAGITANDFLSLLVTEMKNQDPTQQTDPMTYITQLVGVNSLEQLVQINQDLTPTSTTGTTSGSGSTPTGHLASASLPPTAAAAQAPMAANPFAAAAPQNETSLSLPAGSHLQMSDPSSLAVSQAFVNSVPRAAQVTPSQLAPVSPEALRAIQMSIPGASITGASSSAASTAAAGGQIP